MAERKAVVIGAGISGVLVARELLLAGWEVEVLEARHVGAGSSSRTAAGIRQQFSTPSTVRGMRYAVAAYQAFQEEVGARCLVQQGYLFLHATPEAWQAARARVSMQRQAGLHTVEALSADALVARFPWVDPSAVVGGTFDSTDGFLLPAVIYQEGARRVRELGGRIRTRAPVVGAVHLGERLLAVSTPEGPVEADLFVDATNAWTGRTAAVLGAEALPVAPIKRHLWFVRRGASMAPEALAAMPMVVAPSGVYGRHENEDTLLLGWAVGGEPEPHFSDDDQDRVRPEHAHDTGVDAVPFQAWLHFAEAVPAVGAFDGIVATTSGYYAVTPDHNPFLGFDSRIPNLLRLVGFSGHGVMLGPFTARVAASLADAGRDLDVLALPEGEVDLSAFRIGRAHDVHETMVI